MKPLFSIPSNNPAVAALGLDWQPAEQSIGDSEAGRELFKATPNAQLWSWWNRDKAGCKAAGLSVAKDDDSGKWTVFLQSATPQPPDPNLALPESIPQEEPPARPNEIAVAPEAIPTTLQPGGDEPTIVSSAEPVFRPEPITDSTPEPESESTPEAAQVSAPESTRTRIPLNPEIKAMIALQTYPNRSSSQQPVPFADDREADTPQLIDISLVGEAPENKKIYADSDIEGLAKSIEEKGVLEPIVVDRNHVIISGHRRYRACLSLGMTRIKVIIKDRPDEQTVIEYNIQRDKSNEERLREFRIHLPIEQEKAAVRRKAGKLLPGNFPEGESGDARTNAGKLAGIDGSLAEKGLKVLEAIESLESKGDQTTAERLRTALNKSITRGICTAYSLGFTNATVPNNARSHKRSRSKSVKESAEATDSESESTEVTADEATEPISTTSITRAIEGAHLPDDDTKSVANLVTAIASILNRFHRLHPAVDLATAMATAARVVALIIPPNDKQPKTTA